MRARYLVIGHGHFALDRGYGTEKVWLVSGTSKGARKRYAKYNKEEKLVVMPPFNELITGSALRRETKGHLLVLKDDVFSFGKGEVYDLKGRRIGSVDSVVD
jgi:metallophosphoesterase superfamily enzyme